MKKNLIGQTKYQANPYCPNCITILEWKKKPYRNFLGMKIKAWFLVCADCGYCRRPEYAPSTEIYKNRPKRKS